MVDHLVACQCGGSLGGMTVRTSVLWITWWHVSVVDHLVACQCGGSLGGMTVRTSV